MHRPPKPDPRRLRTASRRLLIQGLSQFVRRGLELIESVVQLINAAFSQRRLRLSDRRLNFSSNCSYLFAIVGSVFSIW